MNNKSTIQTIPEKIIIGFRKSDEKVYGNVTFRYGKAYRCGKDLYHEYSEFPEGPKEYNNCPVEGFKIMYSKKVYRTKYRYDIWDLVDIQDPRGFLVSINLNNFIDIVKSNDIIEGILCGQFVYSWDEYGEINMTSVESDTYKKSININRELRAENMTPGSLYMFKLGTIDYNLREKIEDNTATFLGAFKLAKEFGKKYETEYLFTNKNLKTGKNFVFCKRLDNVDYEIEKDHISETEIKNLTTAFKQTAYSWDFWNPGKGSYGCVKRFIYLPSTKFSLGNDKFKNPTVILDEVNEFTYVKSYVEYLTTKGSYRTFVDRTDPRYYPAYKFSIVNGVPVPQKIADLGKFDNKYRYYWGRSSEKTIDDIYTHTSQEERDKVKKSVLQEKDNPTLGIVYETMDGKISDSLQILLSVIQDTDILNPWRGNYGDLYHSRLELPEIK